MPHAFVRPDEALALNGTTSGRAMEGVEIRVVDEDGNDVGVGVPGEELSRGPSVFVGYLKAREITDGALDNDGWFHSGDLCIMDEHGNIHIIGRKKDMIVRGGENLNTNEINDALEGCPGMGDHTIIGMPDDRLGERICAFAVPLPGHEDLKLEDVLDYLHSKKVPKRFWPERLELIDRIPHTGSGKVKKYLLKEGAGKAFEGMTAMIEQKFGPRRCRDTRKPLEKQCPDVVFYRCPGMRGSLSGDRRNEPGGERDSVLWKKSGKTGSRRSGFRAGCDGYYLSDHRRL